MVWVKIKEIADSKFNNSKLAIFYFFEKEEHAVISNKVLHYLKVTQLSEGQEIYVNKTFNNKGEKYFVIKDVKAAI